ncbi:MAG TPA: hypothetical protein VFT87_03925 [Candidatus Saccharimonadales bacterium]|nr:hypothetical protein [Candidatus Saccharimonadales bacterium]
MSSWKDQSDANHTAALAREARIARIERKQRRRRQAKLAFVWIAGIATFFTAITQFYTYKLAIWTADHCSKYDLGRERLGSNCKEMQPTLLLMLLSTVFAVMVSILLFGMIMCLRGLIQALFGNRQGMKRATEALGPLVFGLVGTTLISGVTAILLI